MERQIAVLSDIKDVTELLNGARIDRTRVVSGASQTQVIVDLTRAMVERPAVVQPGLFRRSKTLFTKSQLVFSAVRSVTNAPPAEGLFEGAIMNCEPVKGGYQLTLRGEGQATLVVLVDRLDGVFQDVGQPIDG
jgi:hypothetical protein